MCIVPKNLTLNTFKQLMGYGRLTEKKVRYIVRHKRRGKSNREIAFEMRVSVSTVKRVWSYWLTHREYLPIRKRGRKVKELSEKEKKIVRESKMKYKLGARRLEKVIEQVGCTPVSMQLVKKQYLKLSVFSPPFPFLSPFPSRSL